MPAERIAMRQVRDVLRLNAAGVSGNEIARRVGVAPSTVRLTLKGVIFRYLARLMTVIPNATIHTLIELMEDGELLRPYMAELDGSARRFFETQFFTPIYDDTKRQVLHRLWGVLSNQPWNGCSAIRATRSTCSKRSIAARSC